MRLNKIIYNYYILMVSDGCKWVRMMCMDALMHNNDKARQNGHGETWECMICGCGGREISRHIMFGHVSSKKHSNLKQTHRTCVKSPIIHLCNLTKAKASQEQHKTRATDENPDLQFCAQTQWQQIRPNDLAKKKLIEQQNTHKIMHGPVIIIIQH